MHGMMSNKIVFVWTDADGEKWRKDADYQALKAENEKLRQALEEIFQETHMRSMIDTKYINRVAKAALD